MPEFEQQSLNIELSSDEETTYEQTEICPELRRPRFWPSAKDIRIGRVGLYHARLALDKAKAERLAREQAKAETSSAAPSFPRLPR